MNQKTCNLCNALHPLDAKECAHCSGNFEKKEPKYVIDESKHSSNEEIKTLIKNSEELFFQEENYETIVLGSNAINLLLDNLRTSEGHEEYSIILALRMCGVEIWGNTDESFKFKYRLPGELNFHYLISSTQDIGTAHKKIIDKLKRKYPGLELKTNNHALHTIVYKDQKSISKFECSLFQLDIDEVPILECSLPNNNYFLMTTKGMYSFFSNELYMMPYTDFDKSDRDYYRSSKQLGEGETRVFKYYSKKGDSFIYEIDSLYPADASHNTILHEMTIRRSHYNDDKNL